MSEPIDPADAGPGHDDPIDDLDVPLDRGSRGDHGPQFAAPGQRRIGRIALIAVLLLLLLGGIAAWRKSSQPPVAVPEFATPPAVGVSAEPAPAVNDLLIRLDGLHEALTVLRAETAQALREQGETLGQLRVAGGAKPTADPKLLDAVQVQWLGQRLQGLEASVQGLGQRLAAAAAPKPVAKPRAPRAARTGPAAPRIEAVNFWDSVPYASLAGGETLRAGESHQGWTLLDVEDGRAVLRGPDGRRVVQAVSHGGR